MRSLQVKFSLLVVILLVVGCTGIAWIAIAQERRALTQEAEKRAHVLAKHLAGAASEALVVVSGDPHSPPPAEELLLRKLASQVGSEEGVVEARVLGADGRVWASADASELGERHELGGRERVEHHAGRLRVAVPMIYSDVRVGEAQIALDLDAIIGPVIRTTRRQLTAVAALVVVFGVAGGIAFVALLVGPLRRLRAGVERLAAGDFAARVPPTSRDEVGELTRAFNEMGESLQQKQRIQGAFGRYVSDYVLSQLLESPEGGELSGVEREVTILFADIRRFTRLSEGMKARDVVALLNDVFQLATDCILAHGGTIDKFIGDSVMAYFGAPVTRADHAPCAVRAAIDLERAIAARSADSDRGGTDVQVGIGIHTGAVVVGTIGSDRRTDFTAIGDAVNVAHRLEKLARPGEILVSEAVQRRVRDLFRLRFEGERQLSGRQEPVHVYSVDVEPAAGVAAAS